MESILTDDDEHCYICELSGYDTISRHEHHIFFGPLRDTSERMGFKVPLCAYHHNMSKNSVHFDRNLDVRGIYGAHREKLFRLRRQLWKITKHWYFYR